MAKAPLPGTVKTRLVPPLTAEQAAQLYRALLLDQFEHLRALGGVARYVFYAPANAEMLFRDLAGADYTYRAQSDGDLGERMKQIIADLWRLGHQNLVLIGSDLPALPLAILDKAFVQLARADRRVVLGPSEDGGYYLIGMNQPVPALFANMTWSHPQVLAETTRRLDVLGVSYDLLSSWFDLDRVEDLRRLHRAHDSAIALAAARTLAYLEQLSKWGCLELAN